MYFTWQYLVHPTAWVPIGGSLIPWMPCTDLVLPDQHPSSTDETYSPLIFWEECLDKDNDVCVTGHKKKAFCGDIYCSDRPWQQLDSMVITNNQEENWAFLLPGLAARRWSQFHHGLQYFYPGCSGLLRGYRTTRESKARWWPLPHRLCLKYLRRHLSTRVYQEDIGTQKHGFADVRGSSGS